MDSPSFDSARTHAGVGIAILRLVVGIVFLAHGAQKLFVFGHAAVTGSFTQMGIPLPGLSGAIVMIVEFVGGIALVLGLFTRIAAILLAVDMLGAIAFVHLRGGFFLPNGAEFALTLLAALVALALTGPGAMALDITLLRYRSREATAHHVGAA